MLRLSKKSDYAIVALSHLYKTQQPASAREISSFYSFPPQMVANILKELTNAGLLKSKRGIAGGYFLERDGESITIAEVVQLMEGPVQLTDCAGPAEVSCNIEKYCPCRVPIYVLYEKIQDMMKTLSLADISK